MDGRRNTLTSAPTAAGLLCWRAGLLVGWSCDGCFGGSLFVEGAVAEHGEQDADALAGEAQECLGVGFAAGAVLVVVGPGGWIGVHAGEGGEEHGAFELSVSSSGCVFAVD